MSEENLTETLQTMMRAASYAGNPQKDLPQTPVVLTTKSHNEVEMSKQQNNEGVTQLLKLSFGPKLNPSWIKKGGQ